MNPEPYYTDEWVTLYHGDALGILAEMPMASVDILLTDPPYSSGGMFRSDRAVDPAMKYRGWTNSADGTHAPTSQYGTFAGDNRDQWAWLRWVTAWSSAALRVARAGAHAFMFTDWRQLPAATDAAQFGGWAWRGLIVWDKGIGRPIKGTFRNHLEYVVWSTHGAIADRADDYPSTLISVPTVGPNEREHVTQKPVQLLQSLLRVAGPGPFTVLDPFCGSGSSLIAARQCGHRSVGIELEERYCEITANRLAQNVLDFGVA